MQQLLEYFWNLCLLRTGPERSPSTPFAFGAILAVYLVLTVLTLLIGRSGMGTLELAVTALIGVTIQAIILYLLLAFTRFRHRFLAVMSALVGANSVVLVITLPLAFYLSAYDTGTLRFLVELLFLTAFLWWLAIAGFILHRSAGISMLQGVVIAFGIEMLAITSTFQMFPANG